MSVALVLFEWFEHGGLQRDCRRIAQCLIDKGMAVTVICMSRKGPSPEGIRWLVPKLPDKSRVARRRIFASYVMTQKKNFTLVVGCNRVPGLDIYFAADTCFAWKATRERPWYYRLAARSRQYLAFEKALFGPGSTARLLMLSPQQKEEYLACYPDAAGRMTDLPPGIARDRAAGPDAAALRSSLRTEYGLEDDELLVLQVGSGFSIKGLDRSLAAIAALPEPVRGRTRLFIIGRDDPDHYRTRAQALGIGDRVVFLAGRDDLPRYYQGADLLLHPSRKESAGMVILEAIVAGLPVLTTASCGYAFHVMAAQAGLVVPEPFSQQALNDALAAMLVSGQRMAWRDSGIAYGRTADLYSMHEHVADLIINRVQEKQSDR